MLTIKKKLILFTIIINIIGTLFTILFFSFTFIIFQIPFMVNPDWRIILILLLRISTITLMSVYMFNRFLNQEAHYFTDANFLFALFFNVFIYGKVFDFFVFLHAHLIPQDSSLFLLHTKVRHIFVVVNTMPLFYLGLFILLSIFATYVKKLTERQLGNFRKIIFLSYFSMVSFLIIIAPSIDLVMRIYSIIIIITFVGIILMFFIMHRYKGLSQANGLIIGIGFLIFIIITLYTSSLRASFVSNPVIAVPELIIAELIDMIIFLFIFLGFIMKPKYAR